MAKTAAATTASSTAATNFQSPASPAIASSRRAHAAAKGTFRSYLHHEPHDSDPEPTTKSTPRFRTERGLLRSRTLGDEQLQLTDNDDDDSDVTALLTRAARVRREFASGSSTSSLNSDPTLLILGPSPTKEPLPVKSSGPRSEYAKLKAQGDPLMGSLFPAHRSPAEDQSKFVPSSLTPSSPSAQSKQSIRFNPTVLSFTDSSLTNCGRRTRRHRLHEEDEDSSDSYFDASSVAPAVVTETSRQSPSSQSLTHWDPRQQPQQHTSSFAPPVHQTAGSNDRDDYSPSKSSSTSSTKSKSRKPANKSNSPLTSSTNPTAGSSAAASRATRSRSNSHFLRRGLSAVNSYLPSNFVASLLRSTQALIPSFLYKASPVQK